MSTDTTYKFPTQEISLPSKGYFYPEDNALAKGVIELKYPTAREEDILMSRNLFQKGIVVDEFLKALIQTPKVKYEDILNCDKAFLMIASRVMLYGPDYKFTQQCPNCNHQQNGSYDLNNVEPKQFKFDNFPKYKNEFEFTLPKSKKDIRVKLLNQKDERDITDQIKAYEKLSISKGVSFEFTTRLKKLIIEVDGSTERKDIDAFVDRLLSIDSKALRDFLVTINPDINISYTFVCDKCGYEKDGTLPIGQQFFWPTE